MISKTYLRYIWLIDTIDKSRLPLDFEHIVKLWQASPYAYMGGLSIRTFHEHRKGIKEMFDIDIACDKSSLFTYYIKNPEVLKKNTYAQMLLRKYSVPQDFSTFSMMRDRIILEDVLGYIKEKEAIRHLALERFINFHATNIQFDFPKDFIPRKYYDNVVGIYVNDQLPLEKLKIRVYGVEVEYLRMLPLHKS